MFNFNNANSGYIGWSMSNRANEAYERGEMPFSKWHKGDIVNEVVSIIRQERPDYKEYEHLLNKVCVSVLRDNFLRYSSWHHVGKFFKEVDFYEIDYDKSKNITFDDINKMIALKPKKELPQIEYGIITFEQWEGSRRWGKFVKYKCQCIIKGNTAYLVSKPDSVEQDWKKTTGFHVLDITIKSKCRKPKEFDKEEVVKLRKKYNLGGNR